MSTEKHLKNVCSVPMSRHLSSQGLLDFQDTSLSHHFHRQTAQPGGSTPGKPEAYGGLLFPKRCE